MSNEQKVIVIAIDNSSQAQETLLYYIQYVHKATDKVVLVHVVELPDLEHSREVHVSPAALADMWREEEVKSEVLKQKFQSILESHQISDFWFRNEAGPKPGQAIVRVAAEERASIVVMGTRGMGKLRRTILGSVSEYVLHHAHCPVLICRK